MEKSLASLKKALVEAPVVGYPDPNGHFILDTDASAYGIGPEVQQGGGILQSSCPERRYCVARRRSIYNTSIHIYMVDTLLYTLIMVH